jgi:type I restriction enzyme S subunit
VTTWHTTTLGELCDAGGGFVRTGPFGSQLHQSDYVDDPGAVPVVMPKDMAGGQIERSSIAFITHETADRLSRHLMAAGDIALSRRGDVGRSAWIGSDDLPVLCGTGTIRIHLGATPAAEPGFVRYFLRSEIARNYLEGNAVGATMPNLNAAIVEAMPVSVPPPKIQRAIASALGAIDDLIENNRRRAAMLEEMAKAIYQEWFVHFRYPGRVDVELVESPLGPIPEGWRVRPVEELTGNERWATTSGPFGSKLGTRDYLPDGVPVLRGANLSVGGGFNEAGLVYVSAAKAEQLASSTARRGDLVVTQRGTLGQVGLIPKSSAFDQYIVSQSQMKVTFDASVMLPTFAYAQFRTKATTARFVANAITSGVPHVNLAILRKFDLVCPPLPLQEVHHRSTDGLAAEADRLRSESEILVRIRDLLLPRLVSGRIDLSTLDLDEVVGAATA